MEINGFQIVENLPALYHSESDLLVISDLHLGLEKTMTSKGNYVPSHQLDDIKKDLKKARAKTNASRILVNGDLKNEYKTSYSESKEIKEFIDFAQRRFEEVIIIEGTHDTMIESSLGDKVKFTDYFIENKKLYVHGDKNLEEIEIEEDYDTIIIGHEHPALALKDDVGVREKFDCFLYGQTKNGKEIIVLPAFSSISNGTAVNETPQSQLLSPILRENVDKDNLKAIGISREAGLFEFPELGYLEP